jgi:hypothetical protein
MASHPQGLLVREWTVAPPVYAFGPIPRDERPRRTARAAPWLGRLYLLTTGTRRGARGEVSVHEEQTLEALHSWPAPDGARGLAVTRAGHVALLVQFTPAFPPEVQVYSAGGVLLSRWGAPQNPTGVPPEIEVDATTDEVLVHVLGYDGDGCEVDHVAAYR